MKKRKLVLRRSMAAVLSLLITIGCVVNGSATEVLAAKKPVLSKKSLSLDIGKSKTIKVKNYKKKVKWSIKSGKKYVVLKKKSKSAVVIKAKKAGVAKVQAKAGTKKLLCKVTVKKAGKSKKNIPVQPDSQPVISPDTQPDVTAPTVQSTPTPMQPVETVAYDGTFDIMSVQYDGEELERTVRNTCIFVTKGDCQNLKERLPDLSKLKIQTYAFGETLFENVHIENVVWHDEPYYSSSEDNGYYSMRLVIFHQGKKYYCDYFLVEKSTSERPSKYNSVKGTVTCANGSLVSQAELWFVNTEDKEDYSCVQVEDGNYVWDWGVVIGNSYDVYWQTRENPNMKITTIQIGNEASPQVENLSVDFLYEVSGVVNRFSQAWGGCEFSVFPKGGGPSYSEKKTDMETGSYQIYLPAGIYTVWVKNVMVDEIEVGTEDVVHNITADLCKITGKILLNENTPYKEKRLNIRLQSSSSSFCTDELGNYTCYAPIHCQVEYVTEDWRVLDSFETGAEETVEHNVNMGMVEVIGILRAADGEGVANQSLTIINSAGEKSRMRTTEDGSFSTILEIGEYSLELFEGGEQMPFSVSSDKTNYDMQVPLYKVSGIVYDVNSEAWQWHNVGVRLKGETTMEPVYQDDLSGRYWIYLPAGDYEFGVTYVSGTNENGVNWSTNSTNSTCQESITVTDKVISKDLHFKYCLLKGKLIGEITNSIYVYDSEGNKVCQLWKHAGNDYAEFVNGPGVYTIKSGDTVIDTVTISEMITEYDIQVD